MKKLVLRLTVCFAALSSVNLSAQDAQNQFGAVVPKISETFQGGRSIMRSADLPAVVVNEVKSAPLEDQITINEIMVRNSKIIRTRRLIVHEGGVLDWRVPANQDFVVLAVEHLVLNVPADLKNVGRLLITPPVGPADLNGDSPPKQPKGRSGVDETGGSGDNGVVGIPGGDGKTYRYPTVYVIFKDIELNTAVPSTVPGLHIFANGVAGGNGGRGGDGGDGGNGGRGKAGRANMGLCKAGPGRGGDAGNGGLGGRGGNAGTGGDGANFVYAAPEPNWKPLGRVMISIFKGAAGQFGLPGNAGSGGTGGGGGKKPFECISGRSSGHSGVSPSNPSNIGAGEPANDGKDGTQILIDRSNVDIW